MLLTQYFTGSMWFCATLLLASASTSWLLPLKPETETDVTQGDLPVCSSYDSLCVMNYRYITDSGEPVELFKSQSNTCKCQNGNTCSGDWFNMSNSIVQTLTTERGFHLEAKIEFCELASNQKPCAFGSPVLTTKGQGPISFELATPMSCRCARPLVAQASWEKGAYFYTQYGCGQAWCTRKSADVCKILSLNAGGTYFERYLCRCRRSDACGGDLPTADMPTTNPTCFSRQASSDTSLAWKSFKP